MLTATAQVVPEPANGSSTRSAGVLQARISCLARPSGNVAKCLAALFEVRNDQTSVGKQPLGLRQKVWPAGTRESLEFRRSWLLRPPYAWPAPQRRMVSGECGTRIASALKR